METGKHMSEYFNLRPFDATHYIPLLGDDGKGIIDSGYWKKKEGDWLWYNTHSKNWVHPLGGMIPSIEPKLLPPKS